jgi:hypothetical protein
MKVNKYYGLGIMEDVKYIRIFINQHTLLFKDAFKDTKIIRCASHFEIHKNFKGYLLNGVSNILQNT